MNEENNNTPDVGTDVETTEAVEVVEEVEATEYTIADLLNIDEEAFPEFGEENHRGMKPLHSWLEHLPEDVRKHVANIRSSYTRKTQELSTERKALEALREELLSTKEGTINNTLLESFSQVPEDNDVYTEDGMKAEIKRQAAEMLKEMLQPAQQKIQMERKQMELNSFKREHPEITTEEFRMPIAQLLMERPELRLQDAYYIVKGKVDSTAASKERAALEARRSSHRDTLKQTSTGKSTTPSGSPQFRDAWTAYQHHKAQGNKK
tara:strand:+ start:2612 stop:3406 length:795 start_codon:yes stop_codon:yes gene_type:complete